MRTSPVINKLNYRPWIKGSDLGSDGLAALAAAAAGEAGDEADQEEASDAEPQHRELADQVRGVLLSLAGECSVQLDHGSNWYRYLLTRVGNEPSRKIKCRGILRD